jgi:hypothetical protein
MATKRKNWMPQKQAEPPGPVTKRTIDPEAGQQWLADLLRRARANKPPRWGKPQRSIDDDTAPGEGSEHRREGLMNEPAL